MMWRARSGWALRVPPGATRFTSIHVKKYSQAAAPFRRVHRCAATTRASGLLAARASQQASQAPVLWCSRLPASLLVSGLLHATHRLVSSWFGRLKCCRIRSLYCSNVCEGTVTATMGTMAEIPGRKATGPRLLPRGGSQNHTSCTDKSCQSKMLYVFASHLRNISFASHDTCC